MLNKKDVTKTNLLLASEIEVTQGRFSLEYLIKLLDLDAEELGRVLQNAANADDYAFFLHTGFAMGRMYERTDEAKKTATH